MPGKRFVSIIEYISENKLFFTNFPMGPYRFGSIISEEIIDIKAYKQLLDLKFKKAKVLEGKFNKCPFENNEAFDEYTDKICLGLGFDPVDEVCEQWIRFFSMQEIIAPIEEILKLRMKYIRYRKLQKSLFSSFPNIRNTLLDREYSTYCKTGMGNRSWKKDIEGPDPIVNNIIMKMFMRSLSKQLIVSGINHCPYSDQTIFECEEEIPECKQLLNPNIDKYSSCGFGILFKSIFGVELKQAFVNH